MSRAGRSIAIILVCAAIGVALIWGFLDKRQKIAGDQAQDLPVKTPSRVTRNDAGETILTFDRETQERIGLRTLALPAVSLPSTAIAYGLLEVDPAEVFIVRAPVAGTLEPPRDGAWPAIGQSVNDGAIAAMIAPRMAPVDRIGFLEKLSAASADMRASEASVDAARAAFERAKTLNADNKNVSDRVVEEAEARLKSEEARRQAAAESVHLLQAALQSSAGPSRDGPTAPMPLIAERGGEVVEVLAHPGESIESGQPVLRLARFHKLLARVEVPAGDNVAGALPAARIVVLGHETRPLTGERVALTATVDPRSQGQGYVFRVANPGLDLRPGTAVQVSLGLPGPRRSGVIVPAAALVRYAGKVWCYVASGPQQFIRKEVQEQESEGGGWFTQTVKPNARVVLTGAQVLLSEEFKSQIQVGEENPE
ncbi:MAG TPA: HlyD family efflux transporter periplasmic adaptor subunit [Bryobacteraceae bacterium]|nr:HlyD family efflux transporter periplasmic adaptor subunit [Bryobacteraceae bacterium]